MSRALNLDATIADVIAASARYNVAISAIESLSPSGTRVVFTNADGAAIMAKAFRSRILAGSVTRTPWRQSLVS